MVHERELNCMEGGRESVGLPGILARPNQETEALFGRVENFEETLEAQHSLEQVVVKALRLDGASWFRGIVVFDDALVFKDEVVLRETMLHQKGQVGAAPGAPTQADGEPVRKVDGHKVA